MSKDELGVAIVGSGDIARVHLPNIAKCPSMRLVATMDLVEEAARSLAEAGGAACFTTDLDRLLADQEVDALVICSALDTHVSISLEALSAGKHVFSEKPLAMTLEEARRLQRAVVETGMQLMSGWWFKHSPITSRVRQVIEEPNLVLTTLLIPDVYDLPPDDTRSPYSRGGILENGGYNLHWTWHVVRSQPIEVSATGFGGRPVNTTAITIQFENGAVGCSVFSNRGVGGTMPKWFAQVLGDEESAGVSEFTDLEFKVATDSSIHGNGYRNGFNEQMDMFAALCLNGGPNGMDVWEACMPTLLFEKAILSMESHQPQPINYAEDFYLPDGVLPPSVANYGDQM